MHANLENIWSVFQLSIILQDCGAPSAQGWLERPEDEQIQWQNHKTIKLTI